MSYSDTFVGASVHPAEKHRLGMQRIVDYEFQNASSYYTDIEVEDCFGSLEFRQIDARVVSLIDVKTGQRINDDYKKIIFPDINYKPDLGSRFRFDKNIWIIFSTDNVKSTTSAVYVRRCNNTINIQDKFGNVHKEPCYIDYNVTETQPYRESRLDVPRGRIWVMCQLNEWTNNIDVNDRYMFGDDSYRIRERSKFDKRETFAESANVLSFFADYDGRADYDFIKENIADHKMFKYNINIPQSLSLRPHESGFIKYDVTFEGEIVDDDVVWESTDPKVATVDEYGMYNTRSVGECDIICRLKNNPNFFAMVHISVAKVQTEIFEDMLTPDADSIKINATQEYEIYEYLNGYQLNTKFDIKCYDVPEQNYKFTTDGNKFSITNLRTTTSSKLKVICTNNRNGNETIIYIRLGGLF